MHEIDQIRLTHWVESLMAKGRNSFSLDDVRQFLRDDSEAAIKLKLTRLSKRGNILSVHKGYYLIISPQYASRGILPPALFVDGLMNYLNRPYYVGLLSAAAFYGAAHQQPQEYYVFTELPALRPVKKKALKINYVSKSSIPAQLLEKRKTEIGYLTISSPELTAVDLIQYEKRVGGLNRVGTVLNDLADAISKDRMNDLFISETPVAILQRLGYLLENVLRKNSLADHLYQICMMKQLVFFRIPLRIAYKTKGFPADDRWKVIINTNIEIDE
jgi:predicted transcriptional regulator of viral defense system